MTPRLGIRTAVPDDLPLLHAIAERAVWKLLAGRHYDDRQLEVVRDLRGYEVESALVEAGTYYVLEVDGVVVGGSGWSSDGAFHPTHGEPGEVELRPPAGVAVMRASYVEPDWGRRGFATLLAGVTESAAVIAGFRVFEAMCTPASEGLRRKLGYALVERVEVPLVDGVVIPLAHMRKELGPPG